MAKHSTIVGGSNADRLLNCPGSYQATIALPASANVSSEYAEEGTAMHKVMDSILGLRLNDPAKKKRKWDGHEIARSMAGSDGPSMRFHDRILTSEHIDTMIEPALDALHKLEKHYGGGFEVLGVELLVNFPGIPGAHGTCDLILGSKTHILHVDWKFGQGVPVKAVYVDEHGERLNAQMMFYTTGAIHTHKKLYDGKKKIVIAIIQPRTDEPLTHTVVTSKDIDMFIEDMHEAVVRALDRNPSRMKGEHCRFAVCKVNCPLWTGPTLDLSALGVIPRNNTDALSKIATPYGEYLARAKTLVDILVMFKKEVDEQLHAYLEDGGIVPGWRLKAKVKQRQWVDEDTVAKALKKLGFKEADIWQKKLITFQSADATAKRLGVTIPEHLRVAPPTNDTTIATVDDPAPVVEKRLAIENFRASLVKIKENM